MNNPETSRGQHRVNSGGRRVLPQGAWRRIERSLGLSQRGLSIIQSVFDDRSEPAIARELGISAHTVHTYLERLYHRLDVRSRIGLVLRIVAEHLAMSTDRPTAD